ncbi:hypothetical protein PRIPAC_80039 [Pristionchus pacificus]|uniref:Uncharacterized protein n=1 Tax=Pristionchus pacificus TaxID=54126 RepID=A0A2A6CMS8_PRIPA|nr:hypothetical protein PRIPAC_80039 [Pristionchus pacificus]|eukprot:PDM79504.1 hypothetical protein PRIPAC_32083 [Pristionchus pacificus]
MKLEPGAEPAKDCHVVIFFHFSSLLEGDESSPLDIELSNYPIVQAVHIFIIFIALPPVILLLTQLSRIALHHNCKQALKPFSRDYFEFLLHAWASAFMLSIGAHIAFVACDFFNGRYVTERNDDPPIRLLIFAMQTTSALLELNILSILPICV